MKFLVVLFALVAVPAFAAIYDGTATMPAPSGATSCQLVINGTAVGLAKPCDSLQSYPSLFPSEGTYQFAYRGVNAGGQGPLSPITTVTISLVTPPGTPAGPPRISVACTPSPCPPSIVITIAP